MSDDYFEKGKGVVKKHTKAKYNSIKAVTFTVLKCLWVGYGKSIFESREQLKRGLKVIHDHFSCFGIKIRVGKSTEGKIKAPKT